MLYLVLANLYLAVFFAFYWAVLRKQTFFRWNRAYLLVALALAFILPMLENPAWNPYPATYPQYLMNIQDGEPVAVQAGTVDIAASRSIAWSGVLVRVYAVGCAVAFLLFLWGVLRTWRRLRTATGGAAFSFFGIIRIDRQLTGYDQISAHEQVHAREWHSADLVLMQIVKIFNWFNPVVFHYERALRLQHEYIADSVTATDDKLAYAELLVTSAMGVERTALMHTFSNKRLLKNRVAMLLRSKSCARGLWRYTLLLPVIAGMVVFSIACNQQKKRDTGRAGVEAVKGTSADADVFMQTLGKQIDYRKEAIEHLAQGTLAVIYEKKGGSISDVKFLNAFGYGQEEEVLRVLQLDRVKELAPEGKNLFVVAFNLSGVAPTDMPPPPPPVSAEYIPLGEVTILAYAQEPPPPPPVEPKVEQVRFPKEEKTEVVERDTNLLFQSVEVPPQPPGGMRAFMEYIGRNYDFPQEAIEAAVNGQVQVSFVVEKDGTLTDIKVVKDLGYGTGDAAIRVLQSSSKWRPGIQNGRAVRVAYTLPIRLNLQS